MERSPGYTPARCSRWPSSRASWTCCASSSTPFADALDENRDLAVFFFSPYFSTVEKQQALEARCLEGAEEAVRQVPRGC